MADLKLWCVIVLVVTNTVKAQDTPTAVTLAIIGKSFWPPSINLLELLKTGTPVYIGTHTNSCLHIVTVSESPSRLIYYKNSNAFYKSIGVNLDINVNAVSYGSISNTIDHLSQNFKETARQGTQLDYGQYVKSFDLNKGCLARLPLDPVFENELLKLPLEVENISSLDSFADYKQFVSLYGGFVLTGVKVGARLEVFATAEESQSYSEKQFNNRVCAQISLASFTAIPVDIGPCIGVSVSELKSSLNLQMSTRYFARGGNRSLQAQLSTQGITPNVLTKFIQSASKNPYPVDYKLTPLWDLYTGNNEMITKRLDNIRLYFNLLSKELVTPDTASVSSDDIPLYIYVLFGIVPTSCCCICSCCCVIICCLLKRYCYDEEEIELCC